MRFMPQAASFGTALRFVIGWGRGACGSDGGLRSCLPTRLFEPMDIRARFRRNPGRRRCHPSSSRQFTGFRKIEDNALGSWSRPTASPEVARTDAMVAG